MEKNKTNLSANFFFLGSKKEKENNRQ